MKTIDQPLTDDDGAEAGTVVELSRRRAVVAGTVHDGAGLTATGPIPASRPRRSLLDAWPSRA